ncbi:hypothetical protein [Helicobacter sp. 12S02232-10]|nr:hypothetical protein [Helicobacter sp. 12S02232-10]
MDNIDLNSVKRKGAVLFYSYLEFKNRIPMSELSEKIQEEDEDF